MKRPFASFFALILGLVVLSGAARAETYTFTLPPDDGQDHGPNYWNNSKWWSPNGIPGAEDTAIVNNIVPEVTENVTIGTFIYNNPADNLAVILFHKDVRFTIKNTCNWKSGQWGFHTDGAILEIALGATMNIVASENSVHFIGDGLTVQNKGTINAFTDFLLGGDYQFINDGEILFQNDADWTYDGGYRVLDNWIVNNGAIRKVGGTDISHIDQNVVNHGTIDVQSGTLQLFGTPTDATIRNDGVFKASANCSVRFENANPHRFSPTAAKFNGAPQFSGAGKFVLNGALEPYGTINFGDGVGQSIFEIAESGNLANPDESDTNRLVIRAKSLFKLKTGILSGNLRIAPDANLVWTDSIVNYPGVLTNNGTAELSGSGQKLMQGGTFNNAGRVNWLDGDILLGGVPGSGLPSKLNNSGTFVASAAKRIESASQYDVTNTGIFRKTGAGKTQISGCINNGTLQVQQGTLELIGSHRFGDGSKINGAGAITFGNLDNGFSGEMAGVVTCAAQLTLKIGTFTGNGTFDGPGALHLQGGNLAGTLKIGKLFSLLIEGDGEKFIEGTVKNLGRTTFSGTGNVISDGPFDNRPGGVFSVRTNANFDPIFLNSGTVAIGSATATNVFHLDGPSFTQTSTGNLIVTLNAAAASTSRLSAFQSTLAGNLTARFVPGYTPTTTTRFPIIVHTQFTSRTGKFATVTKPEGFVATAIYNDPDVSAAPNVALEIRRPNVSGRVYQWETKNGVATKIGISGATVTLNPGNKSAQTDAEGNYTLQNVVPGTYTLAATKSGVVFDPKTLSVTVTDKDRAKRNFATYSIAAKIVNGKGVGISGVTINLTGKATATGTTDANGKFVFKGLGKGTYIVAPQAQSGFSFEPAQKQRVLATETPTGNANFTRSNASSAASSARSE